MKVDIRKKKQERVLLILQTILLMYLLRLSGKVGKFGEVGMKEIIIAYDENTEASPIMGDWIGELVRCKDCKHHGKDTCGAVAGIAYPTPDDWFCADGERAE